MPIMSFFRHISIQSRLKLTMRSDFILQVLFRSLEQILISKSLPSFLLLLQNELIFEQPPQVTTHVENIANVVSIIFIKYLPTSVCPNLYQQFFPRHFIPAPYSKYNLQKSLWKLHFCVDRHPAGDRMQYRPRFMACNGRIMVFY